MRELPVLINRAGGAAAAMGDSLADRIAVAFAVTACTGAAGIRIQLVDGPAMPDEIGRLGHADRIVVGGGDGTMSSAAAALAGKPAALALLPLGTLNHLARDLGIPADLEGAAKVAAGGRPIQVDLGTVNGQYFVNNVSLGVYPSLVTLRDSLRTRLGLPKWLATIPAAWAVLKRYRLLHLRIDTGSQCRSLKTPLLFVGNNSYSLLSGEVGTRASLSDGRLSLFAVEARGRLSFLWFALRAALGKSDRHADFVMLGEFSEITVETARRRRAVEAGLDGEVRWLAFPLEFRAEPAALTVIGPCDAGGAPEARVSQPPRPA